MQHVTAGNGLQFGHVLIIFPDRTSFPLRLHGRVLLLRACWARLTKLSSSGAVFYSGALKSALLIPYVSVATLCGVISLQATGYVFAVR
jgi:hypothetical protein